MPLTEGAPGTLWTSLYKMNAGDRGYQFKCNYAGIDEAEAVMRATDISARMKKLLPISAEIMFATLSNNNSQRDATFLRDALGKGQFVTAVGPPAVPALMDASFTGVQIRLENPDRQSVQRIFNPLPDTLVTDQIIQGAIADVTSMPLTVPAVGAGTTWYEEMGNFLKAMVMKTHYVKSGHAPGGLYQYSAWRKAFIIRIAKKKGGRAFI